MCWFFFFSPQATTSTKYHDSNPEFKQFLKIPLMVIQVASVLNLSVLSSPLSTQFFSLLAQRGLLLYKRQQRR